MPNHSPPEGEQADREAFHLPTPEGCIPIRREFQFSQGEREGREEELEQPGEGSWSCQREGEGRRHKLEQVEERRRGLLGREVGRMPREEERRMIRRRGEHRKEWERPKGQEEVRILCRVIRGAFEP